MNPAAKKDTVQETEASPSLAGLLGVLLENKGSDLHIQSGEVPIGRINGLSPITVEGQFLGLIVLGGKECDYFDLNALHLVRGVARQAAQAIMNARHREEEIARSRQYVRF